ncbi:MAG: gamma-glutamyltransferase family protein [Candidatus Poribacteria bacterium]|nr:gamma-glutamyltransferase family protein [Candidatus Poribacteria bacterium]
MNPRPRKYGTVVGPHPRTAYAGMSMLRQGGNAIDAAVAAAFTEGVVEPSHNGVAGYGGCMVVYLADRREVVAIDYNTVAPAAASDSMFTIELTDTPAGYRVPGRVNVHGPLSVGVPGVVGGLCMALQEFGTMPLSEVLLPAIRSARYGFVPNRANRNGIVAQAERWQTEFPETARVFLKNGHPPKAGERLTNPDLARTLETIADGGASAFYCGDIGHKIVNFIQENGGCLTAGDLQNYRPRLVKPYEIRYRDCQLYTPPLGAGGLTTLQMLRLVEAYDVGNLPPAKRLHLLAETMKICWPERLGRFGDPDSVDINPAEEVADALMTQLRNRLKQGLEAPQPGEIVAFEPISCTSHISTADIHGNLVALTQTHGGGFGSMVTVPGTGLLLGHGVARFDPRPGLANSIAPGKRPLHNMSPIIALQADRPFATYGIPGGRTIPNNQLSISVNLIDLQMSIQDALAAPRLHSEGAEPVAVEERAGEAVLAELRQLGHEIELRSDIGGPGHGIVLAVDATVQAGGTDPRGEGRVISA